MTIYDKSPLSKLLNELANLDNDNQAQLKATTVALKHLSIDLNNHQPLPPLLTDLQSVRRTVEVLPQDNPWIFKIISVVAQYEKAYCIALLEQVDVGLTTEQFHYLQQVLPTLDLSQQTTSGYTLLSCMVMHSDEKIGNLLPECLTKDLAIDLKQQALIDAASKSENRQVLSYLLDAGIRPNLVLHSGEPLLFHMLEQGQWDTFLCLIDHMDAEQLQQMSFGEKTLLDQILADPKPRMRENGKSSLDVLAQLLEKNIFALSPDSEYAMRQFLGQAALNATCPESLLLKMIEHDWLPLFLVSEPTKQPLLYLLQHASDAVKNKLSNHLQLTPEREQKLKEIGFFIQTSTNHYLSYIELEALLKTMNTSLQALQKQGFTQTRPYAEDLEKHALSMQKELEMRRQNAEVFIEKNKDNPGQQALSNSSALPGIGRSRLAVKQTPDLSAYLKTDVLSMLIQNERFMDLARFARMLLPNMNPGDMNKPVMVLALDKVIGKTYRSIAFDDLFLATDDDPLSDRRFLRDNIAAVFLAELVQQAQHELASLSHVDIEETTALHLLLNQLQQALNLLAAFEITADGATLALNLLLNPHFTIPLVIPIGFKKHSMVASIEKNPNGTCRMTVYNTGDGVEEHYVHADGYRYQTHLIFDQIPEEDLLKASSLAQLFATSKQMPSAKETYALIHQLCSRGIKLPASTEEQDYEQAQLTGSCSRQSHMAFIRHFIMQHTPGSAWKKLGLYKAVKAHAIRHLLVTQLGNTDQRIRAFVEQKIKKYDFDLVLLALANDPEKFHSAIKKLLPLLDATTQQTLQQSDTTYARFAVLRALLKTLSHQQRSEACADLGLLSEIIQTHKVAHQEVQQQLEQTLDRLVKQQRFESAYDLVSFFSIRLPSLETTVSAWLQRQDQSTLAALERYSDRDAIELP